MAVKLTPASVFSRRVAPSPTLLGDLDGDAVPGVVVEAPLVPEGRGPLGLDVVAGVGAAAAELESLAAPGGARERHVRLPEGPRPRPPRVLLRP